MINITEAINNRRSIRNYSDRPIEPEKIDAMLHAAMQAPSAGNQRSWEFIVVQNHDSLTSLSKMCSYSWMLAGTPLAIIILGNKSHMIYPENWEADLGMASQNLMLEAVRQNLGSVFLTVNPHKDRMSYVINQFSLPDHLWPYAIISIGYPDEKHSNKFVDRYIPERVHYESLTP